jgi:CRISPR-associated protein Cas2
MSRRCVFVTYDVGDPKRWRKVFRIMKDYGDHLQLSVFRVELPQKHVDDLKAKLAKVVTDADQVLFVDVGPAEGLRSAEVTALGRPYLPSAPAAVIV